MTTKHWLALLCVVACESAQLSHFNGSTNSLSRGVEGSGSGVCCTGTLLISHTNEHAGLRGHAWSGVSPGAQTYEPGVPVAAALPRDCVLDSLSFHYDNMYAAPVR